MDPDEASQNVRPHLKSKLFETQILNQQNFGLKQWILQILKDKKKIKFNAWKNFKIFSAHADKCDYQLLLSEDINVDTIFFTCKCVFTHVLQHCIH